MYLGTVKDCEATKPWETLQETHALPRNVVAPNQFQLLQIGERGQLLKTSGCWIVAIDQREATQADHARNLLDSLQETHL